MSREILEKYIYARFWASFVNAIQEKDFDKLEKELRDLIEWNHVGNDMIQIGNKFYVLAGRKLGDFNDELLKNRIKKFKQADELIVKSKAETILEITNPEYIKVFTEKEIKILEKELKKGEEMIEEMIEEVYTIKVFFNKDKYNELSYMYYDCTKYYSKDGYFVMERPDGDITMLNKDKIFNCNIHKNYEKE